MVKLNNLFQFDNLIINYLLPIIIATLIYIFYKYYKYQFINIREKFTNNIKLCKDNSCGMGCEKPTGINDSCPPTIYKDVDGNCHRKCPYICSNKNNSVCKYDECCVSCGYTKIPVPCELEENSEYSTDEDMNDDEHEKNTDEKMSPSPNKDKTTTKNNNSKSKNLNDNMTNVEHRDLDFKGWSPYVTKWPCSMNVTGTFTECGPLGYNSSS